MSTPTESDVTRTTGYPVVSPTVWWQLRKLFQNKGVPKVFDAEYLINLGIRQTPASANNVIRPFTRFGLFKDDGKPEQLVWDWVEDPKYAEVCDTILHKIYPEALTSVFTTVEDQGGVERWFQRTLHITPASAHQYAAFYMLLLEADPTKQEAANGTQSGKPPKTAPRQPVTSRPRSSRADAHVANNVVPITPNVDSQHAQVGTHSEAPRVPHTRSAVEPTLNINVQIHIPAEATAEQIEQIFKSMGKHLFQRQDEADA